MQVLRTIPAIAVPSRVEIYHEPLDQYLRIENEDTGVAILTGPKALTKSERACLLRCLAAEGFIAANWGDPFQGNTRSPADDVRWSSDLSWIKSVHRTARFRARWTRPILAMAALALLLAALFGEWRALLTLSSEAAAQAVGHYEEAK